MYMVAYTVILVYTWHNGVGETASGRPRRLSLAMATEPPPFGSQGSRAPVNGGCPRERVKSHRGRVGLGRCVPRPGLWLSCGHKGNAQTLVKEARMP